MGGGGWVDLTLLPLKTGKNLPRFLKKPIKTRAESKKNNKKYEVNPICMG